jgi:hypothetical protein
VGRQTEELPAIEIAEYRAKVQKLHQELFDFYGTTKMKVSKLECYPNGQALLEVYWRTMF